MTRTARILPALALGATLLAGLAARPAHAQFTVYTDRAGYTPAAKAVCPDIDNLLVNPTVGANGPGHTVYGATQDGIGLSFYSASLLTASGGQSDIDGPFKDISITPTDLGLEVLEFNLNGAQGTKGDSVTLTLNGGQTVTQALDPGLTFFGIIADHGSYVTGATINSAGAIDDIRQVRVCAHPMTTAAVPEPASLGLLALGGLGLLPLARRARRGGSPAARRPERDAHCDEASRPRTHAESAAFCRCGVENARAASDDRAAGPAWNIARNVVLGQQFHLPGL